MSVLGGVYAQNAFLKATRAAAFEGGGGSVTGGSKERSNSEVEEREERGPD